MVCPLGLEDPLDLISSGEGGSGGALVCFDFLVEFLDPTVAFSSFAICQKPRQVVGATDGDDEARGDRENNRYRARMSLYESERLGGQE